MAYNQSSDRRTLTLYPGSQFHHAEARDIDRRSDPHTVTMAG